MRVPKPKYQHYANKALGAFTQQRYHARRRDIPFHFTFESWVAWWTQQLGPDWLSMRGRNKGQYVMARLGDVGPYEPSNVKCIYCEENQSEQSINGTTGGQGWNKGKRGLPKIGNKLSPEQVKSIFIARGKNKDIAVIFSVDASLVSRIKNRKLWGWLTEELIQSES